MARVLALYQAAQYAEALAVATGAAVYFPQNAGYLKLIRAMLAARTGDAESAFALLAEILDGGYWPGERQWADADFDSVRDQPHFAAFQARAAAMRQAVQAITRPEVLTVLPEAADAHPLLIALHGNYSSVRWHNAHWRLAPLAGWLLAMPQSSQVSMLDSEGNPGYVWDDVPVARREIAAAHTALTGGYPVQVDRVVLGGFSRGAEMAVHLALAGDVPASAVIAVCPGGPLSRETALWEPIIAQGQGKALRFHVIVGRQDTFAPAGETLADLLQAAGFACTFEAHEAMCHDYPSDFRDRLRDLLAAVAGAVAG